MRRFLEQTSRARCAGKTASEGHLEHYSPKLGQCPRTCPENDSGKRTQAYRSCDTDAPEDAPLKSCKRARNSEASAADIESVADHTQSATLGSRVCSDDTAEGPGLEESDVNVDNSLSYSKSAMSMRNEVSGREHTESEASRSQMESSWWARIPIVAKVSTWPSTVLRHVVMEDNGDGQNGGAVEERNQTSSNPIFQAEIGSYSFCSDMLI